MKPPRAAVVARELTISLAAARCAVDKILPRGQLRDVPFFFLARVYRL